MKDDLIKSLLAHDVDEPVPEDHERQIRAGLGALLAPVAPSPNAPKPTAPTPPSPVPQAAASAASKLIAYVAIGAALVGGIAGFAIGRATAPASAPGLASSSASASATTTGTATVPSIVPSGNAAPATTDSSDPVALGHSAQAPSTATLRTSPSTSPSSSASADAFDRERSLLDRARAALVRHDATAAAQALDESERDFPKSQHAEERAYLRIQIARERGETERVRTLARAFLTTYPKSLYRGRVEPLAQ